MSETLAFEEFRKIARLNRECVITEKLDGTNAQIYIGELANYGGTIPPMIALKDGLYMYAGSRNRWIHPNLDNYGFAKWAMDNANELFKLGVGRHFGEWWGNGIQRGYGLSGGDKRFWLFNTHKWSADVRPACCGVVPVLYQGPFKTDAINAQIERLRTTGSVAAPGFMKPEGVVVYHTHANQYFKVTLEKDELPKSLWVAEQMCAANVA